MPNIDQIIQEATGALDQARRDDLVGVAVDGQPPAPQEAQQPEEQPQQPQQQQQPAALEPPAVDPEFLAALPPEMRAEFEQN